MDQLLSDCSLSDVLFIRKDNSDLKSQFCPTSDTDSIIRMKSPLNINLETCDELLPQQPSNAIINVSDIINNTASEVEQNKTVNETDIFKPKQLNNEDFNRSETKSFSKQSSNSQKSIEESTISEAVCNHCNCSSKLKIKNTSHTKIKNTKLVIF